MPTLVTEDEKLRHMGYVCEKCNATVSMNAHTRGGCDVELAKKGHGWMYLLWPVCDSCYGKLPKEEKTKYSPYDISGRLKGGY